MLERYEYMIYEVQMLHQSGTDSSKMPVGFLGGCTLKLLIDQRLM